MTTRPLASFHHCFRYNVADAICLTICQIVSESKLLMVVKTTVVWQTRIISHMSKSVWFSSRAASTLLIRFHSDTMCLVSNSNISAMDISCKPASVDLKALMWFTTKDQFLYSYRAWMTQGEERNGKKKTFRCKPKVWRSQTSLPLMFVFN